MTRRPLVPTSVIVLCLAVASFAQTTPSSSENTLSRPQPNAAARLLARPIESVDWIETTLEEVIDWIRDAAAQRVNVLPHWETLAAAGIAPDSLITLKLTDTTVADTLNEVLRQLAPDRSLSYQAERNYLRISTKQDIAGEMYLRVYDATDLVFAVSNFGEDAPQVDLGQTGSGAASGAGQSVFSGAAGSATGGAPDEQESRDELTRLRNAIVTTIAPGSWGADSGGGRGRIATFRLSLLIYNTAEVHEQIAGAFSLGQ